MAFLIIRALTSQAQEPVSGCTIYCKVGISIRHLGTEGMIIRQEIIHLGTEGIAAWCVSRSPGSIVSQHFPELCSSPAPHMPALYQEGNDVASAL